MKQAADVWRKECERLMNGGKPKEIEEEKEKEESSYNEEEIASLKEDMSKMSFEDLKTLAIEMVCLSKRQEDSKKKIRRTNLSMR